MKDEKLQNRASPALKEGLQYGLAFGVIATVLLIAEFPMFMILFLGLFSFFLWKTFSSSGHGLPRKIFEFYLSAHEILRDDDRRWFGFEVREVIARGEDISRLMPDVPPLVLFTIGALYGKIDEHHQAVRFLSNVIENTDSVEMSILNPSVDLRQYSKILRRIESQPADAPQTSAAIRGLERARRNRGKALLDASRDAIAEINRKKLEAVNDLQPHLFADRNVSNTVSNEVLRAFPNSSVPESRYSNPRERKIAEAKEKAETEKFEHRKSITEVLHEIYDRKAR